ncbi:anoctamin-4 isoform X2 [Exaiptasia diaphana]|uniref:Anoctamin n=1 Tax=Exaiptasia diaphana TaxID=2652724 RepID=A0A913XBF6_EXADI|nr:anoctamin-4 isoform X2 [Exaiptasia diaphana]KXJ26647.1 Anoctamin-5 [Exaiptasia diaphana]
MHKHTMAELKEVKPRTAADEDDVLLDMDNQNGNNSSAKPIGLHFNDGGEKIDYVLVYERNPEEENEDEEKAALADILEEKRKAFEKVLQDEGLLLEREMVVSPQNPKVNRYFVKLHIPWKTLHCYAEEIKLKAPLMKNDIKVKTWTEKVFGEKFMNTVRRLNPLRVKDSTIIEKPSYFMAFYKQRKHDKFLGHENDEKLFTTLDRHYAVQRICCSAAFSDDEGAKGVGLKQLIYEGAYIAGYPLHDGDDDVQEGRVPDNDRQRLKRDWSRFGRMFKYQPYDTIKSYFGTAIALYFAWLGFYTAMLVPLAFVGLIIFIYGIASTPTDIPVNDICDKNIIMCNLCDKQCSYWSLKTTCIYARVTHFFDNNGTVFLAIFTSVWATLFLELWKRRQAVLASHWSVSNFEEEEQIRPEFAVTAPTLKRNPVTGMMEPHIPKRTLYQRYGAIGSIIAFMIFLVIAAVVGVVVYRGAVFAALSANSELTIRRNSRIITTVTAAIINLICINILKFLYNRLAVWLTNWENPRTKTDYEDSFTYKMYLFQFVNTYASIFYIAFFKSDYVVGKPGRFNRIGSGIRFDGCSEQGCFLELCIQLIIIMVGQQIIGNITEVAIPALKTWWKERKEPKNKALPQYEQDFNLSPLEDHYMFWEYLEIVLQYGFVTMFVAAFPLAPLFSLLNSIAEIRVDAINFVSQFRRPDTAIAEDIGAWTKILAALTNISVLVNGFILAFTSEFIPKLVYRNANGNGTLVGYVENSLSTIPLSALKGQPEHPNQNVNVTGMTTCRYKGYYESTSPYEPSKAYWHVVAARLAFVFVFQYTVYAITTTIARIIPDKPSSLNLRLLREDHLTKKILHPPPEGRRERRGYGRDRVDSGQSGML